MCKHLQGMRVDFVSDGFMQKNAKKIFKPSKKKPKRRYIVDIDEDYFGCEKGSDIILKSGVRWKLIGKPYQKYNSPQYILLL